MLPHEATNAEIVELEPEEVRRRHDDLVDVYRQAFREPPYSKGENVVRQFQNTLPRHSEREGFRCVVARDVGEFVGFGYGYTSRPGQWWHDEVVRRLDAREKTFWFKDAFEIVELAVRPRMQGYGVGGRLHDRLLEGLSQRCAVLSTLDADTRGYRLYRSRGWQVLRRGFHFSGVSDPYLIMVRWLATDHGGA
jgi:ribosomal protein S18 acetylase RimI-like enzyme